MLEKPFYQIFLEEYLSEASVPAKDWAASGKPGALHQTTTKKGA